MRSLRFKVSPIKNYCRHQALYEWTIGKVQNGTSMYGSYHPTPHMKMFISIHAGSTDKREEMTEKKKHESALPLWQICPFQFAPTKLGTSICFNAAVLEPSFHIASLKEKRASDGPMFLYQVTVFLEMSMFPCIANSMILWSAMFCIQL